MRPKAGQGGRRLSQKAMPEVMRPEKSSRKGRSKHMGPQRGADVWFGDWLPEGRAKGAVDT